jgi:hypothetical protein
MLADNRPTGMMCQIEGKKTKKKKNRASNKANKFIENTI